MVVELGPAVVLRADIHGMLAIEKAERKRHYATGSLQLEIDRGCLTVGGQQRKGRICSWRQVDKSLGQLKRLGTLVTIQAKDEVGLNIGYVAQDHVHVIGNLTNLVGPDIAAGLGLVAERVPGLDAG